MLGPLRNHFVSYWWVWLLIAATVVVANELIDRNLFDHREHIDGDFLLVVVVLAVAFFGSYAVKRRPVRRSP